MSIYSTGKIAASRKYYAQGCISAATSERSNHVQTASTGRRQRPTGLARRQRPGRKTADLRKRIRGPCATGTAISHPGEDGTLRRRLEAHAGDQHVKG